MKIIAIIQARLGSTRLPRKVLIDLLGNKVLEHVIGRVKKSTFLNDVIVATTICKEDLEIVRLCVDNDTRVFCGSENDVLDRYYQAAKLLEPDHVVRITSDCPLMDPKVIDTVVARHLKERSDYTSNTLKHPYPDGQDVEVFTFEALKKAWANANLASEREHVTPYIKKHPDLFAISMVLADENLGNKRWTLDEEKDLKFIRLIYEGLYQKNPFFGMEEILEFVNNNPDVEDINRDIMRDEGYQRSLKEDRVVVIEK